MRIHSKGKAVIREDHFWIELDEKIDDVNKDAVKVINTNVILEDGMPVEGDVISLKKGKYVFYVQQSDVLPIEVQGYANILAGVSANRINKEKYLFYRGFPHVSVDDVFSKRRAKAVVLARNICIYLLFKYFRNQMSELHIAMLYNKDRTSVYTSVDYVKDYYSTDLQIKAIIDDIEEEVKTIYNNLKEE